MIFGDFLLYAYMCLLKQFVRSTASMEDVALDQISAHVHTVSLVASVSKVSTWKPCFSV